MDIRFLESFVIIAESGSIAEAARRLNLTPAALAQRMRALEQDLGRSLVTRTGRTVSPTAAGYAMLHHARLLIEGARDMRAIAADDEPAGLLRLGATATALTGLLPGIISHLSRRYPRIEYFVRPGSSANLYQGVVDGELDAALIVRPQFPMPKSIGWLTLRDEPLMLIAPEGLKLNDPHEAIQHQPFIRYDRKQWGGYIIDRYLRQHALKVREWLELDALDAIAALVNREIGVAIVPDWAPPWPEGLKLQKLYLPDGDIRQTGVVWNLSGARIASVKALVDTCGERTMTTKPD